MKPTKKKPAISKRTAVAKPKPDGLAPLIAEVRQLIQSARRGVASVVDTFQVMTNFEIGRRIVEREQKGQKRAAYGAEPLKELSAQLTEEFGKGFSRSNPEYMRKFFLIWRDRVPQISQQPVAKLAIGRNDSASCVITPLQISQQPIGKLLIEEKGQQAIGISEISQQAAGKFSKPFTLSWTHYVLLLTIKDPNQRSFSEIEATNSPRRNCSKPSSSNGRGRKV